MASITIQSITKTFGTVPVLHDIDLSIGDGEFVVLVGPSGCGKSTLLRMIAGLEDITAGEIRIDDRRINEVAPKDRDIAMVFQSYALYPHMTVADNMSYSLKLRKTAKERIAEAIGAAAGKLGLDPLLERRPKALSGGQRQRVAMGRAIVRHPKAFLFDEPLSNLDARLREQMRAEIKRLHKSIGATSVYVTHDQIEAMTLADRIVAMHGGIIQQVGNPLDLYDRPANLFVAGFIGSPAMNFVEGHCHGGAIETDDGSKIAVPDGVRLAEGQAVTVGIRPSMCASSPVRRRAAIRHASIWWNPPVSAPSCTFTCSVRTSRSIRSNAVPPWLASRSTSPSTARACTYSIARRQTASDDRRGSLRVQPLLGPAPIDGPRPRPRRLSILNLSRQSPSPGRGRRARKGGVRLPGPFHFIAYLADNAGMARPPPRRRRRRPQLWLEHPKNISYGVQNYYARKISMLTCDNIP